MLEVYDHTNSVCAQKVRLTLAEKKLEWTRHLLRNDGDQFAPNYTRLNPNAVVPTLVHDGEPIIESTVICHYLDEVFPQNSLMPQGALERSKVRMFAKLIDEYIHDSCTTLSFSTVFVHSYLGIMSPEQQQLIIASRPNKKKALLRDVIEKGLESPFVIDATLHYDKLLQWISKAMQRGQYLSGDSFSLADIMVVPYVHRLDLIRLTAWMNRWPDVGSWLDRVRTRPAFDVAVVKAMTQEDQDRFKAIGPEPWPTISKILSEQESSVA